MEKEVKLLNVQPVVTYIQNWALTIMSQAKSRGEQYLGIIIDCEAFFSFAKKSPEFKIRPNIYFNYWGVIMEHRHR